MTDLFIDHRRKRHIFWARRKLSRLTAMAHEFAREKRCHSVQDHLNMLIKLNKMGNGNLQRQIRRSKRPMFVLKITEEGV